MSDCDDNSSAATAAAKSFIIYSLLAADGAQTSIVSMVYSHTEILKKEACSC